MPAIEYGVLEIKEEEAKWVKHIFEMAAAGNPATDKVKKISRDESEWVTVEMPEVRIVSDELWNAVKERQAK